MVRAILDLMPYLQYAIPPVMGAFIGYLTNKIAIRMLFRPLREWRIFSVRIPMTPGVIPSKRHQLARNIGEMVGSHLLTSEEIGRGLEKNELKQHLKGVVRSRVGSLLEKDLPGIEEIIPPRYSSYFDIAKKTLIYQIRSSIHAYVHSSGFEQRVTKRMENVLEELLARDVDSFLDRNTRESVYEKTDELLEKILSSKGVETWLEDLVYSRIVKIIQTGDSLEDVLPPSLRNLILQTVEDKTPDLLARLALLIKEPEIQDKLIGAVKKAIDAFVAGLGPMGGMVQGFLNMETVEKAVRDYLRDNEEDLGKWVSDEEVRRKVTMALRERVNHYLSVPIRDFLTREAESRVEEFSGAVSGQLLAIIRDAGAIQLVGSFLRENCESYIHSGGLEVDTLLNDLGGSGARERIHTFTCDQIIGALRSEKSERLINEMVETIVDTYARKPVGRISRILPGSVREDLYETIRDMISDMLAKEVPGLVDTLNIQRIVAEKIDTLDLLKLEELLLSIMQEQFKYINLFGALLGCIIGWLNVILLIFLR